MLMLNKSPVAVIADPGDQSRDNSLPVVKAVEVEAISNPVPVVNPSTDKAIPVPVVMESPVRFMMLPVPFWVTVRAVEVES